MTLCELLSGLQAKHLSGPADLEIASVCYDSRKARDGSLFVAIKGFRSDGHQYIAKALELGAAAILVQDAPEQPLAENVSVWQCEDTRAALARIATVWHGHPERQLKLIGVTGTNGKTTTTYLLKDILEKARGAKVGLIGTNQNMIGETVIPTERTTPESFELQGLFRRMADAGCTHVVMEVSSHALHLKRVAGIRFAVGIFTNLTQDHLDFHKTMEEYCDAKALLFRQCDAGVYNMDDEWANRLIANAACPMTSIGEGEADLAARNILLDASGIAFDAVMDGETVGVTVGIPGGFMVYNTLGVLAAAKAIGISVAESAEVLRSTAHVKGRVEVVPTDGDYTILIDYAHTPDALENVLNAVRGFAKGRVIALFGCGGDRDKTKRPIMGAIAARLADAVIVTSDNPRTENPSAIIADIVDGMIGTETPYVVVESRIEAIHFAMDNAQSGDVIVLAGKGHETYQIIGRDKHHLDEREVVADYIKEKQGF